MKRTPFPMTEMWTNGVVMIVFLGILYVTFIGTGVQDYWKNKDRLDKLVKDIESTFSVGKDTDKDGNPIGALPSSDELNEMDEEKIEEMLKSRDLSTEGDKEAQIARLDDFLAPQRKVQEEIMQKAEKASKIERKNQMERFLSLIHI